MLEPDKKRRKPLLTPESKRRADAALEEFERAGIIRRTGEMRWAKERREYQPVFVITELGIRLHDSGVDIDQYLDGTGKFNQ